MSETNIKIVEEYVEQIINKRQFERLSEFCSDDCVLHNSPYVGLGINFDDSSGEHIILTHMAPDGPAAQHLQIGDELVRAKEGDHIWETFDDLRRGLWAHGIVDTELCLTVRRHGNLLSIPLTRARIEDFDIKVSDVFNSANPYWEKYWPDLRMTIKQILGSGDTITCLAVNSGTNLEYGRSAIWGEIDIFKLHNGKITEIWGIEDTYSEFKQLGYQITEPVREFA
jgi:predicted ester cyclase